MIRRNQAVRHLFSSSRVSVSAALLLLAALAGGVVACDDGGGGSGGDGAGGGGGGDGGGGGTSTDTSTATGTGTSTNGGQAMLSCGDNLSFVSSCRVEESAYTACSDFFGNHQQSGLEAQCVAGNGTYSTTPCVLDNRAGACVFFNSALPDRCYVEHISPPSAADFWEMTCPQVGGSWTPAE